MLKTAGGDHAMAQGAGQGACHHENKQHRPCSLAAPGTPAFAPLELRLASRRLRSLPAEALREGGRASSPVFFAAPGTPYSLFRPRKKRGDGAPSGASLQSVHVPFRTRGASRRAIAAFSLRRRAALSGSVSSCLAARSSRRLSGQPLTPSLG